MSDDLWVQIYNNLISKETEELIDIWQNGDATGWEDGVFEIIKEILLERLGHVPPQSIHTQVTEILNNVSEYLENRPLA